MESGYSDISLEGNANQNINDRFSNIGLANVHQRMKLYFGEAYGIKIMSKPGAERFILKIQKTAVLSAVIFLIWGLMRSALTGRIRAL